LPGEGCFANLLTADREGGSEKKKKRMIIILRIWKTPPSVLFRSRLANRKTSLALDTNDCAHENSGGEEGMDPTHLDKEGGPSPTVVISGENRFVEYGVETFRGVLDERPTNLDPKFSHSELIPAFRLWHPVKENGG